mgnify:CR=1 FL=1
MLICGAQVWCFSQCFMEQCLSRPQAWRSCIRSFWEVFIHSRRTYLKKPEICFEVFWRSILTKGSRSQRFISIHGLQTTMSRSNCSMTKKEKWSRRNILTMTQAVTTGTRTRSQSTASPSTISTLSITPWRTPQKSRSFWHLSTRLRAKTLSSSKKISNIWCVKRT